MLLPLPGYDSNGRKVIIYRGGLHDTSTTSIDQVFKATNLIGDIFNDEEEVMTISGVQQIIDLNGVNPAHGLQMTPSFVKKAMIVWQVGFYYYLFLFY